MHTINKITQTPPVIAFIDSQVYIQEHFNFSEKGKFEMLKKHINKGRIRILTSDIVCKEVERKITERVENAKSSINGLQKSLAFVKCHESGKFNPSKDLELDWDSILEQAIGTFHQYLKELNVTHLDSETINLPEVISDYFEGRSPFNKAKKKSEFPDAFNISMLKHFASSHRNVYCVSGDKDLDDIPNIRRLTSLDDLLTLVVEIDKLSIKYPILNNIGDIVSQKIIDRLDEKLLEEMQFRILPSHGDYYNSPYHWSHTDPQNRTFKAEEVISRHVVKNNLIDLSNVNKTFTFSAKVNVEVKFNFGTLTEVSSFDSNGNPIGISSVAIEDIYQIELPTLVKLHFDEDVDLKTAHISNAKWTVDFSQNDYILNSNEKVFSSINEGYSFLSPKNY